MTEPASTTVAATVGLYSLFIAIFGVTAGEWATIIFASLAGGLWVIGKARTNSKTEAVWILLRTVTFAAVFTSIIAACLETQYGLGAKQALAPVAFVIGFYGDRVGGLLSGAVERFFPAKIPEQTKNTLPKDDL